MDTGTTNDYIADLIEQVNALIVSRDNALRLAQKAIDQLNEALVIIQNMEQAVHGD